MTLLMVLRRMQRDDITTHGFSSSFRDWATEQTNLPRAVCEAGLAHTLKDKTEAAYHRTELFGRRRELMDGWAAFGTSARTGWTSRGAYLRSEKRRRSTGCKRGQ